MNITDKIKTARTNKGLSQKEIAIGFDQAQYSLIENGKTNLSFSVIEKIACTLSELFNTDEDEKKGIYATIDGLATKKKLKQTRFYALAI